MNIEHILHGQLRYSIGIESVICAVEISDATNRAAFCVSYGFWSVILLMWLWRQDNKKPEYYAKQRAAATNLHYE